MTDLPPLFRRLLWAKENLRPIESKYRIVWEDPAEPEAPAKVTCPAPEWLACALHGGILPPIESYIRDKEIAENTPQEKFSWREHGGPAHPYAEPIDPMTEEEAMEYLIMKDLPLHVWRDYRGNRKIVKIVPVEKVPANRTYRNAWEIAA